MNGAQQHSWQHWHTHRSPEAHCVRAYGTDKNEFFSFKTRKEQPGRTFFSLPIFFSGFHNCRCKCGLATLLFSSYCRRFLHGFSIGYYYFLLPFTVCFSLFLLSSSPLSSFSPPRSPQLPAFLLPLHLLVSSTLPSPPLLAFVLLHSPVLIPQCAAAGFPLRTSVL
ncbi:hypothetical protein BJX62DRAFT_182364 [Aspergillus germanicus]